MSLLKQPALWIALVVVGAIAIAFAQLPGHQPYAPDVAAATSYCNYPTAKQVGTAMEAASSGNATETPGTGVFAFTCNGLLSKWNGFGFRPYPSAYHQWCRFQNNQGQVEYHTNGRHCASSHLLFKTEDPSNPYYQLAWYDVRTKVWYESGGSNILLGNSGCTANGPWLQIYVGSPAGHHGAFFSKQHNCGHIPSYSSVLRAFNRYNRDQPLGVYQTTVVPICRATYTPQSCDTTMS